MVDFLLTSKQILWFDDVDETQHSRHEIGFVLTTRAYKDWKNETLTYESLEDVYKRAIHTMETQSGRKFQPELLDIEEKMPILLSLRASCSPGCASALPPAILNIGMNEHVAHYIAKVTHNKRFALDLERRFLYLFGTIILKADADAYRRIDSWAVETEGVADLEHLSIAALSNVVSQYRDVASVPRDPFEQLRLAVDTIYAMWHEAFPLDTHLHGGESHCTALALIVQEMVHGNFNDSSAAGSLYTSNIIRGNYLRRADGEEVNDSDRATHANDFKELQPSDPSSYDTLLSYIDTIRENICPQEEHYLSVEFVIENRKVFLLEADVSTTRYLGAVINDESSPLSAV